MRTGMASLVVAILLAVATSATLAEQAATAQQWTRWEAELRSGVTYTNPLRDVTLRVAFDGPKGEKLRSFGFWDGGTTFRIRCAFPSPGVWRWRTECSNVADAGLHGKSGQVRVVAYRGSNTLYRHGFLRVSSNRRYLCHADGTPFLWMGDTAWAGPFRATDSDWDAYLTDRVTRRFSVVQVGPAMDWAGERDALGTAPFEGPTADRPNPVFWQRYDRKIQRANVRGLVVLMVGLMEPRSRYPEISEAQAFARWMTARLYGDFVAFSPSFDSGYRPLGDEVGKTIREVTDRHLITQHPGTTTGRSTNTIAETYFDRTYMDFAGNQSGHNGGRRDLCAKQAIDWNLSLYRREPHKPVINLEAMYDTEGRDRRGAFGADDARSLGYRSWLSGAMGYTYGTDLYQWKTDPADPQYWKRAMVLPSAEQMTHLRDLLASVEWWRMEPAHAMVRNPSTDPVARSIAARAAAGDFAIVYIPRGDAVELDLAGMRGPLSARWFDPQRGVSAAGDTNVPAGGTRAFAAPSMGEWVLVLRAGTSRLATDRVAIRSEQRSSDMTSGPKSQPQSSGVQFRNPSATIGVYGIYEITVQPAKPPAVNPFTDASLKGWFEGEDGERITVEGFCDSQDGSVFRIRFMPTKPGKHRYSVTYQAGSLQATHTGRFAVTPSRRKGLLRVDAAHPWHFVWEGTGEHYFWNGTTTYAMLGLSEPLIRASIDRLAALKVNRIRAALYPPRVRDGSAWHEPVKTSPEFSFLTNPWVAARPDSYEDPGFDVTRFNVAHWQKYERLLAYAREKDVIVSVIFYVDGARPGTDPFGKAKAGGPDEQRYYRYAAARLSAFSNVLWDVTNEYHLFRDDAWANKMGAFLKECDPYDHLMSVHGHGEFAFRREPWADFAMYQQWDAGGGHAFMLANREKQRRTGRIIPQINEEYGYEDHYPHWGNDPTGPPHRSADNRRRLAWGMVMAGCYQTTGERANDGNGREHKTGGGWINGRGDASMTMLAGYAHIVAFFTRLEWWKLEPSDRLVTNGAMCLAEPGRCYVVYQPEGRATTLKLGPGNFRATRYDPRSGTFTDLGAVAGPTWDCPAATAAGDSVVLLKRG